MGNNFSYNLENKKEKYNQELYRIIQYDEEKKIIYFQIIL